VYLPSSWGVGPEGTFRSCQRAQRRNVAFTFATDTNGPAVVGRTTDGLSGGSPAVTQGERIRREAAGVASRYALIE